MIEQILEVLAAICFIAGSLLTLVAAIGLVRFPDLLSRMHAATKPQVLGVTLLMTGLALSFHELQVAWKVVLVVLLMMICSPVSAHLVGRAGYRTHKIASDLLVIDELHEDLESARRAEEGPAGQPD